VQINFGSRSVSCKIVYYGPGLSGKTTNIQKIHEMMPQQRKGELTSIKTDGDRTLFFDFMSLDLGQVAGMDTRFQIYTVPGQVYYNATRKLVLQGADGIVFVADSGPGCMESNIESWNNLKENLAEKGLSITDLPLVVQWNKRDLHAALDVNQMNERINEIDAPTFESIATQGKGVLETLKSVCSLVCRTLNDKQRTMQSHTQARAPIPAPRPAASSATATATAPATATATKPEAMRFASRRTAPVVSANVVSKRQAPAAPKSMPNPKVAAASRSEQKTDWTPVVVTIVIAAVAVGVALLMRAMNVI
jgi:signal recognition particle receptor subunit beta